MVTRTVCCGRLLINGGNNPSRTFCGASLNKDFNSMFAPIELIRAGPLFSPKTEPANNYFRKPHYTKLEKIKMNLLIST